MTLLLVVALGLLIGASLGALGGGGSVLTVPALVYALGQHPQAATTGSLVIVGVTAATAALAHARAGRVRWAVAVALTAAGLPAALAGSSLNASASPTALMLCLAALMVVTAAAMLAKTVPGRTVPGRTVPGRARTTAPVVATTAGSRGFARPGAAPTGRSGPEGATATIPTSVTATTPGPVATSTLRMAVKVLGAGLVVGLLTGLLGVGGGFVLVPALVLALRMDLPAAVGTSLLVISLNSAVALLGRGVTGTDQVLSWSVIVPFTLAAVAGSLVGKRTADRADEGHLTRAFAVLLLAVATYVLLRALLPT